MEINKKFQISGIRLKSEPNFTPTGYVITLKFTETNQGSFISQME